MRNYYIALRFVGRPDLHMTLAYFRNGHVAGTMTEVILQVELITQKYRCLPFSIKFNHEDWYGPQQTVRVLKADYDTKWPVWAKQLIQLQGRDNTYTWKGHVTCDDKELDLTVNAIALMHKKMEIKKWNLTMKN